MIEAIIFDLGGVLLNLDFGLTRRAFHQLGTQKFDELWSPIKQSPLFEEFERGEIGESAFLGGLREHLRLPHASDAQLNDAWNAMLIDFPKERLEWLQSISNRYRVFLLSNTNSIHIRHVDEQMLPAYKHKTLAGYFEHAYYSHQMGARKPEPRCYNRVLNDQGLTAATTLFVDDLPLNIEAAKSVGLQATLLTPKMRLQDVLPAE